MHAHIFEPNKAGEMVLVHRPQISDRLRRLAAALRDDDVSDLFRGGPGDERIHGEAALLRLPYGAGASRSGRFVNPPHVLELAASIEANRKAEAKAAAAETRRIRAAERKAAAAPAATDAVPVGTTGIVAAEAPTKAPVKRVRKARAVSPAPAVAPAPAQAPRPLAVLTGRSIPASVSGTVAIVGTMRASTGDAVIIDVTGRNHVARGIVVWAGSQQAAIREIARTGGRADIAVKQPANDRFRPSAASVRAA